jgi:hypothetical protein
MSILELAFDDVKPEIIKNVIWANRRFLLAALATEAPAV